MFSTILPNTYMKNINYKNEYLNAKTVCWNTHSARLEADSFLHKQLRWCKINTVLLINKGCVTTYYQSMSM